MKPQTTLNGYLLQALIENTTRPAMTDLNGATYTYAQVAEMTARIHIALAAMGLKPGDKIAFCGKNSSRWAIAFIATISYGAVAVPILNEFKPDSIHHLVCHSEARLLLVDESIWHNLEATSMPDLKAAINLADYKPLYSAGHSVAADLAKVDKLFAERYPDGFNADMLTFHPEDPDDVAVINYTSGSTGMSKGVMLTYRNLWSNIQYCIDGLTYLLPGDGIVCMLPLAHMFGLMVETLHPFVKGCHLNFITRVPSPRVILGAFAAVRPKLIITVPLVLEKIIKTRVLPQLQKPKMRMLLKLPVVSGFILRRIRAKLIAAFGGNLRQIIIGGAGLNKDVEAFLRRIRFPYTVGYGMTECGPLIAYVPWERERAASCGRVVDRMEVRVDSPDPANEAGVLWVRGDNVMKGYYKNEAATRSVMDDGWMNTGDICTIDPDGFIYIRGRDKNMILGPSGQNIYPEEIEQVLNNLPFVSESIVIEEDGKLIALIHPDMEMVENHHLSDAELEQTMLDNIEKVNRAVGAYSRVGGMRIHKEEFEKTPKRSIKRFLYQNQKQ